MIKLKSTSIMITDACTLRCKLCLAYIPYYKEFKHMYYEEMKIVLKNYFSLVDSVEKFSITGGEPLICPDLIPNLNEVLKYSNQIEKEIILISNGTIKVSEELISILKKDSKFKVIINHYGELSKYAQTNYEILKSAQINVILYDENNRYGWIDCRNHTLKHKTKQEIEKQASSCAFFTGKKYVIKNGILYTCTRAAYRIQENLIPSTPEHYINLLEAEKKIPEERNKILNWDRESFTVSCAYCDGLTENSKKYIAAEQLR